MGSSFKLFIRVHKNSHILHFDILWRILSNCPERAVQLHYNQYDTHYGLHPCFAVIRDGTHYTLTSPSLRLWLDVWNALAWAKMLNCERGSCTFRAITQGHKMLKTRAWQFVWTGIHNCLILWKWCLARCNKIQNSYGQSPLRHASLSENITPFPTYTISYYVACLSLVLTNHIASRIIGFSWSSLSELIKAHK